MANLSVALITAQSYLNDSIKSLWTDAILIPFAQEAHKELQLLLADAYCPMMRKLSGAITYVAGATDLGVNQPADLVEPISLEERQVGGTDADWLPITESTPLPNEAQTITLGYWTWDEDKIKFIGASVNREVRILYRRSVTVPAAAGDTIGITFGDLYIGPRTAALAAGSVGNKTVLEEKTAEAQARVDKIIRANRGKQAPVTTP